MDDQEKTARLEELWRAHLYDPMGLPVPDNPEERWRDAIFAIARAKEVSDKAAADGDQETARTAAANALTLWILLSNECVGWAQERWLGDLIEMEPDSGPGQQILLKGALTFPLLSFPPTHRSAISHVATLLPNDLHNSLVDALDALGQSEVQPLLEPAEIQRHNAAWTWDQMRIRAVQHVNFMVAQGKKRKAAQKRVALALGISASVLQKWEKRELPERYGEDFDFSRNMALAAGELAERFDDRPPGSDEALDANVFACMKELTNEPLDKFAQRFQRFRGRYWSRHPDDAAE